MRAFERVEDVQIQNKMSQLDANQANKNLKIGVSLLLVFFARPC